MFRRLKLTRFLALFLALIFSTQVFAQADQNADALAAREAIGTVLVSGLVGGILGLSTLSFYSEPQEHIRNITIGAGVGMIAATIFLISNATSTEIKVDEKSSSALVYPVVNPDSLHLAAAFRF